jgi:transcriptional regulator with XRE-family HTH domain
MMDRIKKLMEKRGLSPAQFADEIGLKRSSLSHILSGRNNPSLDVIMKIKNRYDEVNTDWLLFGTGLPVGREEKTRKSEKDELIEPVLQETKKAGGQQLLSFETDDPRVTLKQAIPTSQDKPISTPTVSRETDKTAKAVRMVVFYSDKTFESFDSR